jgi:hypothetical protein
MDGAVDRSLVFSDDTEFTEGTSGYVTKKTFRIVKDSDRPPAEWRIIISMWVDGPDQAYCLVTIGTDSAGLVSASATEEVVATNITITDSDDTPLTAIIQLKTLGGIGLAHIKYTDIYAIYPVVAPPPP